MRFNIIIINNIIKSQKNLFSHAYHQQQFYLILNIYLRLISLSIKSLSDSVKHIGHLFIALCAWFLLQTIFGVFLLQWQLWHPSMEAKMWVWVLWYCYAMVIVSNTTLCCLAYSSCIGILQLVHHPYWFVHHKLFLIVVCRFLVLL